MDYAEFIEGKSYAVEFDGIKNPSFKDCLFDYQKAVCEWALAKGRCAIFAGTGLGKTLMELSWADNIPGKTLILAPLAVSHQIKREAKKFGFCLDKITVTNYEKLEHVDVSEFSGVVLDESSILKSFNGKTRDALIDAFSNTPYRLAATATPAPNDFMELGNHSQFLGVMAYHEMLATFFVHDGGDTQKWRLKGHAKKDFWKWMAGWSVMFNSPNDLGFDGSRHILPPLIESNIVVDVDEAAPCGETLFRFEANTLQDRIAERRNSVNERCAEVVKRVNESSDNWIIWCNLNSESDLLEKLIPDAVQVKGSDKDTVKEKRLNDFSEGKTRVLVTKPSICGFGMNWQHCHNMAFVGLNDSWEQVYQAIRRCWRFGQKKQVNVLYVSSKLEGSVIKNLQRKNDQAQEMMHAMIGEMKDFTKQELTHTGKQTEAYKTMKTERTNFTAYLGDCVDVISGLPDGSVDYSIYSPPFASLYTYSNSERDMGNAKTHSEFYQHYSFLVEQLYRVLRPGRLLSFHCMNLPTSKAKDGFIGIRDFRGELIRIHEKAGFIFHSEVVIWKDPVTAMQRTKALGLLHKTIRKDSSMSRQGIPDYLVTMRRQGENDKPISHTAEEFPVALWQKYASPVWMDINPSDTLQYKSAREHDDERHICPLQLEVIRRAMDLWTAEGDTVLSPFMGIGSEGYVAIEKGRKFIGTELKESYYNQAVKNLESATTSSPLLDFMQASA